MRLLLLLLTRRPLLPSANALTGKAASARSERERGKWLKVGPQQSIHTRACLVRTVQQYRAREKEKGELCSSSPASAAASRRYPFSFSEPLAVVFILVCRHSSSFRWENRIDRARGGERVSPRGGFLGTTSRTCVHTVGGGGGSPRERIWHNEGERAPTNVEAKLGSVCGMECCAVEIEFPFSGSFREAPAAAAQHQLLL